VVEGFGPVLACMSCEKLNAGQDIDDNDVSFYILTIVYVYIYTTDIY
jgi:hypothetical protein